MFVSEEFKGKLTLPRSFIVRRLHSLTGVAFTLFLCEHLFTNLLASPLINGGKYFVSLVNGFHQIPGLKFIEIFMLALPFGFHTVLGIRYIFEAKMNILKKGYREPSCRFERNYAYLFQRVSAGLLVLGLLLHVIHMRFVDYPQKILLDDRHYYLIATENAPHIRNILNTLPDAGLITSSSEVLIEGTLPNSDLRRIGEFIESETLQKKLTSGDQAVAVTTSAGEAFLVLLRLSFHSLWMTVFYSIVVIAAVYHGCNGLWSFSVRWGIVISDRKQALALRGAFLLMAVLAVIGLTAVWGIYWSVR